jgi:hypothetical protein
MNRSLTKLALLSLALAGCVFSQETIRTFSGEVADSQCSMNVHSLTRSHQEMLKSKSMGGTSASCTLYCIKYLGGDFVLANKDDVYRLDGPIDEIRNFAGEKVKISGTLDGKNTIHVVKIEASDK